MVNIELEDLYDVVICKKCGLVYCKDYLKKENIDNSDSFEWNCFCGGRNEYYKW